MTEKDIIIVGGGISGLYSAYTILKFAPQTRLLILEKNPKRWLGGRANNEIFYGTRIVTGAGIGRKKKDKVLQQLLQELKIPTVEFIAKKEYGPNMKQPLDIMKTVSLMRKIYDERGKPRGFTFKEFAHPILGDSLYRNFLVSSGYTDYENEDVYETLYHYGFDDVDGNWAGLSIPWRVLIEKMADKIGWQRIKTSVIVESIEKRRTSSDESVFIVKTDKNREYVTKKVIVATAIDGVLRLVPGACKKESVYREIHGQPFLRVYGKVDKRSSALLKTIVPVQTVVDSPLYKIIPMDAEKGVYMISYTDNRGADYYKNKNKLENTLETREFWEKEIEKALLLPDGSIHLQAIRSFYWPIGTHYYEPLSSKYKDRNEFLRLAQHPFPNMLVVGEMISTKQGWSEGALESVQKVVTRKWVDS